MSFYPPTENPCVMMRENLKTKCSEYIVVYQDDLCTTSPTPEAILNILQNNYKLNINQDFYLGAKYQIDPGGIMICELMKYLEKLYVNVTILINDNPPKHLKFSLKVTEIVITKGNLTLMPKETTDKHLNDLSRKRKAVDGNVNHCLATGRSLTGCLHFVNHTPIDSYSKRQATVKTATYGSEFVASKTATEEIIDLMHTLRYLGVPIRTKSYLFWRQQVCCDQFHKHWARDTISLPTIELGKQLHQISLLIIGSKQDIILVTY